MGIQHLKKPIIALIAASIVSVGVGFFLAAKTFFQPPNPPNEEIGAKAENSGENKSLYFNILLLGTDARPGATGGNTDTIIVAHMEGNRLALLSIPRDTLVTIPGHGKDKINAAYSFGGPELTARIVSDLIGVPVFKYMLIRWTGFINIVDLLGGVTINIPRNMYYYDPTDGPEYKIELSQGVHHLNGHQALAFVRFRKEALGDIDRTRQQQELLKALVQQAMQPATLLKLPWLLPEIYNNVETNISLQELLAIAKTLIDLKNITVVSQTLPGYFLTINGISYWGVKPELARQVAHALFEYGETTKEIVLAAPAPANQPLTPGYKGTLKTKVAQKAPAVTPVSTGEANKPLKENLSPLEAPINKKAVSKPQVSLSQNSSSSTTSKPNNGNNPKQVEEDKGKATPILEKHN